MLVVVPATSTVCAVPSFQRTIHDPSGVSFPAGKFSRRDSLQGQAVCTASIGYIIPTIPDVVSTWGIYQIVENIAKFSQDIGLPIPPLGIVATKVQSNDLHRRFISDLKSKRLGRLGEPNGTEQPPLFNNVIPQTVSVARGADVDADLRTFKGKYGTAYDALHGLIQEIKQLCEKKKN